MTAVDVSPDGTQIVYSTCVYPTRPGFTYTPSTRRGTDADGNPITFIDSVEPNPELLNHDHELVRAEIDGSEPQRLTTNSRFDNYPAWSPDGTRIAYVSATANAGRAAGISIMSADGSDIWRLNTGFASVALHPPAWSPDGHWLAVAGYTGGQQRLAIHIAAADGEGFRELTAAVSGASWSPDGQRLAFAKADRDEVALYTIAADGSDAQRVMTVPLFAWSPRYGPAEPEQAWIETLAWSPDGSKILYSCASRICLVEIDDVPASELFAAEEPSAGEDDLIRLPSTSTPPIPPTLPGKRAAWSPDGSRIAILGAKYGPLVQTLAHDGTDVQVLVRQGKDGGLQSATDLRKAEVAACAAGMAVPEAAANPDLVRDCETILRVRNALQGTAGLNWSPSLPLTQWTGLRIGGRPQRLIEVSVGWEGLTGQIPPELGQLTQLVWLDLSGNQLTGEIPPSLGALNNLEQLFLGGNDLTGCIPAALHRVPRNDLASLGLPTCDQE